MAQQKSKSTTTIDTTTTSPSKKFSAACKVILVGTLFVGALVYFTATNYPFYIFKFVLWVMATFFDNPALPHAKFANLSSETRALFRLVQMSSGIEPSVQAAREGLAVMLPMITRPSACSFANKAILRFGKTQSSAAGTDKSIYLSFKNTSSNHDESAILYLHGGGLYSGTSEGELSHACEIMKRFVYDTQSNYSLTLVQIKSSCSFSRLSCNA